MFLFVKTSMMVYQYMICKSSSEPNHTLTVLLLRLLCTKYLSYTCPRLSVLGSWSMASTVAPCLAICSSSSLFCAGQKRDITALDSSSAASSGVGGLTFITRSDFHTWRRRRRRRSRNTRAVPPVNTTHVCIFLPGIMQVIMINMLPRGEQKKHQVGGCE